MSFVIVISYITTEIGGELGCRSTVVVYHCLHTDDPIALVVWISALELDPRFTMIRRAADDSSSALICAAHHYNGNRSSTVLTVNST